MPIAEELVNVLGFKLEGEQNLKKFKGGMDDAAESAEKTNKRMAAIGRAAGAGLLAAGTVAVATTRKFAGLEREMNRIGITANASVEDTNKAMGDVQKLAQDLALPIDDVVAGLDTLVASGMDLEQAMAFLPSVAATAQASGSSLVDIANTAQKASSALGLEAEQMQRAFDIMVQGGKDGQFELRDMAQYIPDLANSFASIGYSGEEGLKVLIAAMQTVREDTGSAGSAATNLQNIFGKMYSEETAKKFKDFGVDLRAEMEAAVQSGEGALEAFIRISREAIDGDLSKLPLLFTDQQFRLGMQSLITSQESFDKFLASLNSAEVDGTVFRDLNRILGDTQATLDETSTQWERFVNNVGKLSAPVVTGVLGGFNDYVGAWEAIGIAAEKAGMSSAEALSYQMGFRDREETNRLIREGGGVVPGEEARAEQDPAMYQATAYESPIVLPTTAPVIPMEGQTSGGARLQAATGYTPFQIPQPLGFAGLGSGPDPRMDQIAAGVANMNDHLASMTGAAPVDANITDARTDARNQSVTTTVNVGGVNVQQAAGAPAAVGQAVGNAAANAANQQSRIAAEPAAF